jgi:hypothetical protein
MSSDCADSTCLARLHLSKSAYPPQPSLDSARVPLHTLTHVTCPSFPVARSRFKRERERDWKTNKSRWTTNYALHLQHLAHTLFPPPPGTFRLYTDNLNAEEGSYSKRNCGRRTNLVRSDVSFIRSEHLRMSLHSSCTVSDAHATLGPWLVGRVYGSLAISFSLLVLCERRLNTFQIATINSESPSSSKKCLEEKLHYDHKYSPETLQE